MLGLGKKFNAEEITNEIQQGSAILVDVRGGAEWQAGHAKDAIHISVDRIIGGELPTHDKAKKIYLYCASGGRASMAAQYLKGRGYTTENLGGFSSWKSAGGAVEQG